MVLLNLELPPWDALKVCLLPVGGQRRSPARKQAKKYTPAVWPCHKCTKKLVRVVCDARQTKKWIHPRHSAPTLPKPEGAPAGLGIS